MTNPIEVEPYLNYRGELVIKLSRPQSHMQAYLTRGEAMALRDALSLAIEMPNRGEAK